MNKSKIVLAILCLVIFLDVLGFGLVIPVLTPLLLDVEKGIFGAGVSTGFRNIMLGLLLASFPLAQFVGAPILGVLADRYGRKKLLVYSLLGTFWGYLLFTCGMYFEQIALIFLGRLVAGFMGGNIAISLSIVADITESEEAKTKRYGLLGVAVALGVILGPFLGGVLSHREYFYLFSYVTPFVLATILALLNVIFVQIFLEETRDSFHNGKIDILSGPKDVWKAFTHPSLQHIFLMTFFHTLGFNFFAQFFAAYLFEGFGITEVQTGYLFAYTGLWLAISQGIAVRYLAGVVNPVTLLRYSLFCLAFVFLTLLLPEKLIWFYFVLPLVALFEGFILPNTTTLISSSAEDEVQGEVLGIYQSVQALAQVFPPIIAGFIASLNESLPIVAAGVSMLIAWGIFQQYAKSKFKTFSDSF